MITVATANSSYVLKPTIFPDGTSQVWKLPEDILLSSSVDIDWRFESEREVLDLLSLRKLLGPLAAVSLHVPYMPYARQDKEVSNSSTFNFEVIADLINSMNFYKVSSNDVHNPLKAGSLIKNFVNIYPTEFQEYVIKASEPDYIVFPDVGAQDRYNEDLNQYSHIVCDKTRNQLTGEITGHKVVFKDEGKPGKRFLIVDDLCDGGATFLSVAKLLRSQDHNIKVDLCVTHGLFSKGQELLLANGIDTVYTTNSLTRNKDGYKV
jgi:ribose-phosphate pyrophosphokinase